MTSLPERHPGGTFRRRALPPAVLLCLSGLPALCAEKVPASVALLPLIETSHTGGRLKWSEAAAEKIRAQLDYRPEVRLIEHRVVLDALTKLRAVLQDLESAESVKAIARELKADYIVMGFVAAYSTALVPYTYLDIRIRDGATGSLVGWACERSDRVRVASMTISSPSMEQEERLGSYIAERLRRALAGTADLAGREPVVVFPFAETTGDRYGAAAARMLATDLMDFARCLVIPPPAGVAGRDGKDLVERAKDLSAKYAFLGKVTAEEGRTQLRVSKIAVADGKCVQESSEGFSDDADIRVATSNLAQRFAPGGERILWRLAVDWAATDQGPPPFSDPRLDDGRLTIDGVKAPVDPLTGREMKEPEEPTAKRKPARGAGPGVAVDNFSVVARDAAGKTPWARAFRSEPMLSDAVADKVLAASRNGEVCALARADGKLLWRQQLGDRIATPAFAAAGRVYAAAEDGTRVCLSLEDGSILWSYSDKGRSLAVPAANDKVAYFANEAGGLVALGAEKGERLWDCKLPRAARGALRLYKTLLYAACADGRLYCLAAESGRVLWNVPLRSGVLSAPLVVPLETLLADGETEPPDWANKYEHMIFVNSLDGYAYALGGSL